jgi:hypothetical protein
MTTLRAVWIAVLIMVAVGFAGLGLYVIIGYARCRAVRRRLGKPMLFMVPRDDGQRKP